MHTKKVISKNVTEKCTFSLLLMFVKLVLIITFFWCIFSKLFQRIRNQREMLRFLAPFLNFFPKKNFLGHISTSNFEAKRAKNGSKNQKTYLVNVSQISILHPSQGLYSSFSKKKSNSLYPIAHPFKWAKFWVSPHKNNYFPQHLNNKYNPPPPPQFPLVLCIGLISSIQ